MTSRETVVAGAVSYVRKIGNRRQARTVTADDVQRYLDNSQYSGNTGERRGIVHSVLRTPTFVPIGYVASSREAARGRMITNWQLNPSR